MRRDSLGICKDADSHTGQDLKEVSMLILELIPVPTTAHGRRWYLPAFYFFQVPYMHTVNLYWFYLGWKQFSLYDLIWVTFWICAGEKGVFNTPTSQLLLNST